MSIRRGNTIIAGLPEVDNALSTTSTRPVQNQAIKAALDNKADTATTYTKTEIDGLFAALYPVGSLYIGTQDTCPLTTIIAGSTWELVAGDRSLQGSSSTHTANSTIEAGLPNITGYFGCNTAWAITDGSLFTSASQGNVDHGWDGRSTTAMKYSFDASKGNTDTIYGKSSTVQPAAYVVNVWRRTA